MKINGYEYQSFVLSPAQVALASNPPSSDQRSPSVQVMSGCMVACVSGVASLLALRDAIDFALENNTEVSHGDGN